MLRVVWLLLEPLLILFGLSRVDVSHELGEILVVYDGAEEEFDVGIGAVHGARSENRRITVDFDICRIVERFAEVCRGVQRIEGPARALGGRLVAYRPRETHDDVENRGESDILAIL